MEVAAVVLTVNVGRVEEMDMGDPAVEERSGEEGGETRPLEEGDVIVVAL
jgi:hypothetical protein